MLRRPATFAVLALAGVGALIVVWASAFHLHVGFRVDDATLRGFRGLASDRTAPVADVIAHLADPLPFALAGFALAALAVVRRRPRVALGVVVVLAAANATSQILKPALAAVRTSAYEHTSGGIAAASWPSGHATASMSLVLAAVLVVPARLRPTVATLGAAFAVAVCYSLLALGWHFPSDVLGGYLVAATWTCAMLAVLLAADRRWPARTGRDAVLAWGETLAPPTLGLVLAGLAAVGLAVLRPHAVLAYAQQHTVFLLGAATIAALGFVLASGLAVALRRDGLSARRPPRRTR